MQNIIMRLLEISMFSSLMVLAVLGIKKIFGSRINHKILSLMWLLIMLRMVVPITIDSPFRLGYSVKETTPVKLSEETPIPTETVSNTSNTDILENNNSVENIRVNTNTESVDANTISAEIQKQTFLEKFKEAALALNFWHVGFGIWILGCVYLMILKLYRIMTMKANIKNFSEQSEKLTSKLFKLKNNIGLRQDVRIAESIFIDTPIVFGILKPIIIMPKGLTKKIESKKLNMIILHELCHIKRLDIIKNFVWLLFKCVYWFNPIVYIGYKSYLDDVEDACDMKVVSYLSKELKCEYAQSLLDVVRIAKHDDKFPVAVSFCEDRNTLERRITNMIRPKSKLISAGVVSVILCIVMLFGCFTTACLPTDETVTIANEKNKPVMNTEKRNEQKGETKEDQEEIVEREYSTMDIKEVYECSDNIIINIDAQMKLFEDINVQTADVTYSDFSRDFVKKAAHVLFEGEQAYNPRVGQTKSEIQHEINKLEFAIANPEKSNSDGLKDPDPKGVEETIKMFENRIEIYKEMMKKAPETIEKTKSTFEFEPSKNFEDPAFYKETIEELEGDTGWGGKRILYSYENRMQMILDANIPDNYYARITASNFESEWLNNAYFDFIKSTKLNPNVFVPEIMNDEELGAIDISKEEATIIANDLIMNLGITDMMLGSIETLGSEINYWDEENGKVVAIPIEERTIYGYNFKYSRVFGDVPEAENVYYDVYNIDDRPRFDKESLVISVSKHGVSRVYWENKVNVSNLTNVDNMIGFNEVLDIADDYFISQFSDRYMSFHSEEVDEIGNDLIQIQLYIDKIELKMIRVPIEDMDTTYRMIPVWVFSGKSFWETENNTMTFDEVKEFIGDMNYLMINAVNGTIIE